MKIILYVQCSSGVCEASFLHKNNKTIYINNSFALKVCLQQFAH
jgi:hypothetical protein